MSDSEIEVRMGPHPVDPAVLAAMVATTGIDMGIASGLRVIRYIAVAGIVASFLGRGSSLGGWFATLVLLSGLLVGMLWLMYRRYGQTLIAGSLVDRYGPARFKAAQPVIDQANRIIEEA